MESRDVDVQGKTLNFLSTSELKKFLEVADRHVSDDAKKVINYLIKHNSTYMKSMGWRSPSPKRKRSVRFGTL